MTAARQTVTDLIYDAAIDPDVWPLLLERMAVATRSSVGAFSLEDVGCGEAHVASGYGAAPETARDYETRYASENVFKKMGGERLQSGAVVNCEAIVPDRELVRTAYFNEFLRPMNAQHVIAAVPFRQQSVVAVLSVLRPIGAPSFDDGDLARFRRVMPHLKRAVAIHRRLVGVDVAGTRTAAAFDRIPTGVVLLDQRGRVILCNRAAQLTVDEGDGLLLGVDGLTAAHPTEAVTLARLVASACATGKGADTDGEPGGAVAISRPSGRPSIAVMVAPLRMKSFALSRERPAAVAFVGETTRSAAALERSFERLQTLVPAEARLARKLLGEGRSRAKVLSFRGADAVAPPDDVASQWNRLLALADQAWSWRDPESLNEIEALLARLLDSNG